MKDKNSAEATTSEQIPEGLCPAVILSLDLIHHSFRPPETAREIQTAMDKILTRQINLFRLSTTFYNYTGDGYFFSVLGKDVGRSLDLVQSLISELQLQLAHWDQDFRAGVEFGLVELRKNGVTGQTVHFAKPGIIAARLQAASSPSVILCGQSFRDLFHPYEPQAFADSPIELQTKDRVLMAFRLDFSRWEQLGADFERLILGNREILKLNAKHKPRLLIVDDEEGARQALRAIFKSQFEVKVAKSPQEGLKYCFEKPYDIVLTDILMEGMDGVEMARQMLEKYPLMPVIVITAYETLETARRALRAGVIDYLNKPIDVATVRAAVEMALKGRDESSIEAICHYLRLSDDESSLLRGILREMRRVALILEASEKSQNVAISLLRHKARNIVQTLARRIRPHPRLMDELRFAVTGMRFLERLFRQVSQSDSVTADLIERIVSRVKDSQKLHGDITFAFDVEGEKQRAERIKNSHLIELATIELIDNAIDAVEGKVNKTISIELKCLNTRGLCLLRVSDNGNGISEDARSKIFEEGFSTKGDSRGLGLHLVQYAVRQLGGSTTLENRPDGGCAATLLIPLELEANKAYFDL